MSPIARAAALGLTLGALSACAAKAGAPQGPAGPPQSIVVPAVRGASDEPSEEPLVSARPEPDAAASEGAEGKSCCKGQNDCKGKGSCKTDLNDCMGRNECKGKGGCTGHCPR